MFSLKKNFFKLSPRGGSTQKADEHLWGCTLRDTESILPGTSIYFIIIKPKNASLHIALYSVFIAERFPEYRMVT